jgi:hypothetical protein
MGGLRRFPLMVSDNIARGIRAQQILEDELFIQAFDAVERQAIEDMLTVPWWRIRRLADHAARVRAIRDARAAIHAVMINGKDKEQRSERGKSFV